MHWSHTVHVLSFPHRLQTANGTFQIFHFGFYCAQTWLRTSRPHPKPHIPALNSAHLCSDSALCWPSWSLQCEIWGEVQENGSLTLQWRALFLAPPTCVQFSGKKIKFSRNPTEHDANNWPFIDSFSGFCHFTVCLNAVAFTFPNKCKQITQTVEQQNVCACTSYFSYFMYLYFSDMLMDIWRFPVCMCARACASFDVPPLTCLLSLLSLCPGVCRRWRQLKRRRRLWGLIWSTHSTNANSKARDTLAPILTPPLPSRLFHLSSVVVSSMEQQKGGNRFAWDVLFWVFLTGFAAPLLSLCCVPLRLFWWLG